MRILAAVQLIGLSSEAVILPYETIINAPACYNNLAEKVEFRSSTSDHPKFAAGMARRDAYSTPMVYRLNYELAAPELQSFIDFHECVHRQVGDVDQIHPPHNSVEHLMNESIADCIAA